MFLKRNKFWKVKNVLHCYILNQNSLNTGKQYTGLQLAPEQTFTNYRISLCAGTINQDFIININF